MTPAQLAEAGAALFGPLWQSELARQLGVNGRLVRFWAAGARPVPEQHAAVIRAMLVGKANGLARLVERLSGPPKPKRKRKKVTQEAVDGAAEVS